MSNKEPPSLKTILGDLEAIANKVRTKPSFCQKMRKQLKDNGYDWFSDLPLISDKNYNEDLKEQVIKVLAVAVNEAIRTKVDLSGENKVAVKAELHQLLDDDEHASSVGHFKDSVSNRLASMSSPLDMAEYLKKTAPQWFVESIFQHQFDIRWDNGDPADYTFYQFCDKGNTTELLKYIPRQAHVKATLYKECRRKSVNYLRGIAKKKENLCPTVYVKTTGDRWKSWRTDVDGDKFNDIDVNDINTDLWIDSSIFKFITENADEQSRVVNRLKKSLKKPTLYWAVLDDSDFKSGEKEIGQTQVYVGKANNGIEGRWLKDKDSHCKMMKKCLDNVCAMTTYDPSRLEGISLVEARLTLAKVRREETALFVIKTFGDDVEKAKIAVEKAEASLRVAKISLDEAEISLDEAEISLDGAETIRQWRDLGVGVANRKKELKQAIADDSKKNLKTRKSEAEDLLSAAEKSHIEGIILYDDMTWIPKNMGYGMNLC